MGIADWVAFVITFTTAVFSPGPDFLAVLRSSLKYGYKAGMSVAVGISAGTLCWAIATLGGILAILNANPYLTEGLKMLGALSLSIYGFYILYLLYLKNSASGGLQKKLENKLYTFFDGFKLGFFTNTVGNPKAVIFFSVIFVSLIPANITLVEAVVLTSYMVVFPFFWFSLIALVAASRPFIHAYRRAGKAIDTILGLLFIVLGILLLV